MVKEDRATGKVEHFGSFAEGDVEVMRAAGPALFLAIDEARRREAARLHSAGHVLDVAMAALGHTMKPTKGYHFSDGCVAAGQHSSCRVHRCRPQPP